ncbi:mini-chromosome maintenance complex-binding protein isoform X2 [Lycorma delicatula]
MFNRKTFHGKMDECREMLKNPESWNKLPLLNTTANHLLHNGQLVRFEGMVQDMFNPVLYMSKYEVKNLNSGQTEIRNGDYCDKLEIMDDEEVMFESKKTISKEKKPYYCVSIPGLNDWVEEHQMLQQESILQMLQQQKEENTEKNNKKRCLHDDFVDNETKAEEKMDSTEVLDDVSKRLCCGGGILQQNTEPVSETSKSYKLNFPIETTKGIACLINVYDEEYQLKLNEVIQVAGFLSFDPSLAEDMCHDAIEGLPPLSVVPHLHAVAVNKLKHCNPLVSPSISLDGMLQSAENIRAELNGVLRKVLFDDCLVADYLICYLLSTVFNRQNGLVLGKFSLNISNIPTKSDYAQHLYSLLSNLVPKSHYLSLTLQNLNTMTFTPKKIYDTNRLESGLLQLSDHTFLILDETKLEPGKLQERGVRNVQALTNVINRQEVDYDFQYYPLDFPTDIPVLILSEGKSMLPSDFHVVLDYSEKHSSEFIKELFNEAIRFMKNSNLINNFRIYLSIMASLAYKFSEDLQAQIAEDFVRMRQNIGKTSPQDLHDLLVLARLFSISRGSTSLTMQTWEIVQEMEQQRKSRCTDNNSLKK